MVVRLKFKGIDGDLYKWWSMWFNLKIYEEFYLGLILREFVRNSGVFGLLDFENRCCMVVVSLCCEMLG